MRALKLLLTDRIVWGGFLLAFLLLAALIVFLLLRGDLEAPTAPLHYNIYFGIDLAGPGRALLWPWLVAMVITLSNFCLTLAAAERDRLIGRLLAWFSVVVVALAGVSSVLVLLYRP